MDVSIEILKVCAPVSFSALGSHMSVGNFSSKLLLSLLVNGMYDSLVLNNLVTDHLPFTKFEPILTQAGRVKSYLYGVLRLRP